MKINFTLWSTMMNGGVRATFEIINGLSRRGHDVQVTALDGDHSWFPLDAEVNYIEPPRPLKILNPLIRKRYRRPLSYAMMDDVTGKMGLNFDLVKKLSAATPQCDVNVATWYPTSFAVYKSGKGVPFYFFQDFEELAKMDGPDGYKLFRESLKLPLHIITISGWLKEWIKQEYNKDAYVCGDGINHHVFYPRKTSLNLKTPNVMGLFAELEYKGNVDLIKAMNILSEKIENIHLVAVSAKKRTFEGLIEREKPEFEYTFFERPDDDELAELYSSADVFAFPSHVEGFGLPPLEAMACGCPVVTTDCLGVRDYVLQNENALMVPPKNPLKLAESIEKVLDRTELQETLSENGVKTAKKFTWDAAAAKFEDSLKHVLDEL